MSIMPGGIEIKKEITLGQVIQALVVIVVGGVGLYMALTSRSDATDHRIDMLERSTQNNLENNKARIDSVEKAFEAWRAEEKDRLTGISSTLQALNISINTINLNLAKIEAIYGNQKPK